MTRKYAIITTIEPTEGNEIELQIVFTFTPGAPDTYDASRGGPGGWDPGYPPEVEFDSVQRQVDGKWVTAPEFADGAREYLAGDGFGHALSEVADENGPDPDEAYERDRAGSGARGVAFIVSDRADQAMEDDGPIL